LPDFLEVRLHDAADESADTAAIPAAQRTGEDVGGRVWRRACVTALGLARQAVAGCTICNDIGGRGNMIFSVTCIIADWSQIGLEPGDMITTGILSGVALARPEPEKY
jgi:2-keto-4-pentenoate hydratase/2-oxohepta-3-ene-1,7-dioic acid hydratase in catechol pathway